MLTALRVVTGGSSSAVRRLARVAVSLLALGPQVAQAQIDTAEARIAWEADSARRGKILDSIGGEMRRLLQVHWTIPEYHDEQRFVVAGGHYGIGGQTYGPIVNIFASPYLGDFRHTWQIEEQGADGMLVAVVFVDTLPGSSLPPEYQNLNLQPGVNCLWLSYQPSAPQGPWKGSISPATTGKEGTVCRPSGSRSDLRVVRTRSGLPVRPPRPTPPPHPSLTFADYPPVAFFSDATNGQPLLGVSCLGGTCEFGPSSGAWTPTPAPTTGTREERIKGWYDEQWLDEKELATGILRPTVRARLIPRPNLDDLSDQVFTTGWVRVATVDVRPPLPTTSKYFKLGLREGRNKYYLRKSGTTWTARIVPESGGSAGPDLHVTPMLHVDAAVPGTVRWRWTRADAGMWSACGEKCCRL
jgi:hypothetical protein